MGEEVKSFPRVNQNNFDSEIMLNHKGKTLVIFSADWCPYCVSFFNNWSEYGRVEDVCIADITDADSELWNSFDIEVIPTMAVFEDGVLVKRWDGQLRRGLTIYQIQSVNDYLANS